VLQLHDLCDSSEQNASHNRRYKVVVI
jgi:hypothetical protein